MYDYLLMYQHLWTASIGRAGHLNQIPVYTNKNENVSNDLRAVLSGKRLR
jgi:hypothetical protein